MRQSLGETRSKLRDNHALMSGDSHERTTLPNWPGSKIVFVIAPQMGARFQQYFSHMPDGATASEPFGGMERFLFVLEGTVELTAGGNTHTLAEKGYAFVPAGNAHGLTAKGNARLVLIERPYAPLEGRRAPALHAANARELTAAPMKGDDMLMLKKLLPENLSFDCEVNGLFARRVAALCRDAFHGTRVADA